MVVKQGEVKDLPQQGAAAAAGIDLDRLVEDFTILAADYADLDFSAPYGRLDIRRRVPDITAVRIELLWPTKAALQLCSVVIDADGLDDPVAQTVRTMSSTADENFAEMLAEGKMLGAKGRTTTVRSGWEDRPWLQFDFQQPVDLRRIRLRNAGGVGPGASSTRLRGTQVLVQTADGWWHTIYDGWQREREFQQLVEREYGGSLLTRSLATTAQRRFAALDRLRRPAETDDQQGTREQQGKQEQQGRQGQRVKAELVKILAGIQIGTYNTLKVYQDLNKVGLSHDEVAHLQQLVTQKLLSRRQLEFNLHGLRRTFRFWSENEKRRYLQFAVDVTESLQEMNGHACLGFGSVFAVVRDHEFLSHDDDLDVIVGFEPGEADNLAQARELVKKWLTRHGFKVVGSYVSHTWVYPPWGGPKVDVFVGLFEGDSIAWYPGRRGQLTRDIVFPASKRELMGIDCPVPNDPELYLERVYGPGWATPDPHFRHAWKRSEWSDIEK
jgi:hypothetical protein